MALELDGPAPEMIECTSCGQLRNDVEERYSFGYYAGRMCVECATTKFRDGCGIDQPEGDPRELDDYNNDGEY